MIASILDATKLGKVILYSLASGIGIAVIFGVGVSSAAGLLESLRQRRNVASVAWGALAVSCALCVLGAIVLGIVVMASK
jgi:hypothetical protein